MDIYSLEGLEYTVEIDRINEEGEAIVEQGLVDDHHINLGRLTRGPGEKVDIKITKVRGEMGYGRVLDASLYQSPTDGGEQESSRHSFTISDSGLSSLLSSNNNEYVSQRKP